MEPKLYHSYMNSIFAAQLIAADERHRADGARAERLRSFRQRDAEGTTAHEWMKAAMRSVGRRLRGEPRTRPGTVTAVGSSSPVAPGRAAAIRITGPQSTSEPAPAAGAG